MLPSERKAILLARGRILPLSDLPIIMGIVNLTEDSFFEGSRKPNPKEAVRTALAMIEAGARIIDFGAESTRPGSTEADPDEEISRIVPAIKEFRASSDAVVSVDTRHPEVAAAALEAGADIVNDIEAIARPRMADIIAQYQAGVVLMHMQGTPATMQIAPHYQHCAQEVLEFLHEAVHRALSAGIRKDSIIIDPGIGFGKNLEHNLELLHAIPQFKRLGFPVLIGLSRKRMVGDLTGRPIEERLAGSIGGALAAWANGADILRVHDVPQTIDALAVFSAALNREGTSSPRSDESTEGALS